MADALRRNAVLQVRATESPQRSVAPCSSTPPRAPSRKRGWPPRAAAIRLRRWRLRDAILGCVQTSDHVRFSRRTHADPTGFRCTRGAARTDVATQTKKAHDSRRTSSHTHSCRAPRGRLCAQKKMMIISCEIWPSWWLPPTWSIGTWSASIMPVSLAHGRDLYSMRTMMNPSSPLPCPARQGVHVDGRIGARP